MSNPIRVLICDDALPVHDSLSAYMDASGIRHESAFSGEQALEMLASGAFSVIVLDIMLPRTQGMEVCRKIRRVSQVPILMLSARSEESDKVLAFDLGADDYVTKPFSPREVVSRLQALARRGMQDNSTFANIITQGPVSLHEQRQEITVNGKVMDLTRHEYQLLAALIRNVGTVVSRTRLMELAWKDFEVPSERAVDTHIKRLRKKLSAFKADISISTEYGLGYRMDLQ